MTELRNTTLAILFVLGMMFLAAEDTDDLMAGTHTIITARGQ
jgi:hypothetical protein